MKEEYPIDFGDDWERDHFIRELSNLRAPCIVTVHQVGRFRSNQQLRLYFLWVGAFKQFLQSHGHMVSKDLCHKLLAMKFLTGSVFNPFNGEYLGEAPRSLSAMGDVTVSEMRDFMDKVYIYLQQTFGIRLKMPPVDSQRVMPRMLAGGRG